MEASGLPKGSLAGLLTVLTGAAVLAGCGTDSTSSGGGGGGESQTITIWEGYTEAEAKAFSHLVAEYEAQHPGQKVSPLFVNNDDTLQKVLTAVRGGSPPDIAYLYGSWAPNVAQIPQVVNLTQVVKRPGVNWDDFWTGERAVATVNGKVIGIPAVVDNLAVVYNKTLFAKAGLQPPGPDWTWQEFVADAKKLTNPAIKQFGTAYVTPGTEDTVWHWEALLWEAGGQLLTPDNKKAAFDSAAGLASLNTLRTMAVTDKSMYLDPSDSAYSNLFNSGKIGMLVTGPWDLSAFPNVKYGVQVMPSYPGTSGGHQTISGPGQLGRLQQQPGPGGRGRAVPALAHRAGPGQVLRGADRQPADPAVGGRLARGEPADERRAAQRRHVRRQPGQREAGPAADPAVPEDLHDPRHHDRVGAARQEPAAGGADRRRPAGRPGPGGGLTWPCWPGRGWPREG